ncbi:MAG: TetR family transcriptional regulator, partial [Azospirillum brasilense]
FICSECEEAAVRAALDDAAPLYRDAPEAEEARAAGDRVIEAFMRDVLPDASDATRELAGDLVMTTMSTVGKEFSEESLSAADISAYADAMADMFCAYLGNHGLGRRPGR